MRRTRRRATLSLLLAAACGSDTDGGGPSPDARPADARPADGRPRVDARPRPDGGGVVPDGGTVDECPEGLVLCDGACVDLSSDDRNCSDCGIVCPGALHCTDFLCARSNIEHVVLIVQENHTFDSYFATWCRAPAYSAPTCTDGPDCCEAGPRVDPGTGAQPIVLDDAANLGAGVLGEDPNHGRLCQIAQIDDGHMDRFVAGADVPYDRICEEPCSRPQNFAYANAATVGRYHNLAQANAIADRYFQPTVGATSANTIYFLTAKWFFDDAEIRPLAIGSAKRDGSDAKCVDPTGICLDGEIFRFRGGDTIADRLAAADLRMSGFIEGYENAINATYPVSEGGTVTGCAHASDDCPYDGARRYACVYEPADVPFAYFDTLGDDPTTLPGTRSLYIEDYDQFAFATKNGTLPEVAYLHAYTFRNEHPKFSTITAGTDFVTQSIAAIEASPFYADNTLILLVWDEGGGFFDHVDPVAHWPFPPDRNGHGEPILHGPRVPLLAIGPFAAHGKVSHVTMDHSSIVKFLEYNFLPPDLWLGQVDGLVPNIGSLLDATKTGIRIPED